MRTTNMAAPNKVTIEYTGDNAADALGRGGCLPDMFAVFFGLGLLALIAMLLVK